MNILEALERKNALGDLIEEKKESLKYLLYDADKLSESLNEIGSLTDEWFYLERSIERAYSTTMVSPTETISDAISYVDSLDKKINVFKYLLRLSNRTEVERRDATEVDANSVLNTIDEYEQAKNKLVKSIRDLCSITKIKDQ